MKEVPQELIRRLYADETEIHIADSRQSGWAIVDGIKLTFLWDENSGIIDHTIEVENNKVTVTPPDNAE